MHGQVGRDDDGRRGGDEREQARGLRTGHGGERTPVGPAPEAVPGDPRADHGHGHREAEQGRAQRLVEAQGLRVGEAEPETQDQAGRPDRQDQRSAQPARPRVGAPRGLVLQPRGPRQQVDGHQPQGAQHAVGRQPVPGAPGERLARVAQSGQHGPGHETLAHRGHQRGEPEDEAPAAPVAGGGALQLDGRAAQHDGEQHDDERQVGAGQHGGVDAGQARPQRDTRQDDPALVGVPGGRDQLVVLLAPPVAAVEQAQDADAQVVAVEQHVGAEGEQDQGV